MLSCADRQTEAEKTAARFIDAYLSRDLSSVSQMCSPEIAGLIENHTSAFDKADSVMTEKMDSVLKTYSYAIEAASLAGDTAEVRYRIIKGQDTLPSDKIVRMIRGEKDWVIVALK